MGTSQYPESPIPGNFVRRAWHSSVLLTDFVYIDGGEITQNINDRTVVAIQNTTLALDMRESWTNENVTIQSIARVGPPKLNMEILMLTPDKKSFFVFGGAQN